VRQKFLVLFLLNLVFIQSSQALVLTCSIVLPISPRYHRAFRQPLKIREEIIAHQASALRQTLIQFDQSYAPLIENYNRSVLALKEKNLNSNSAQKEVTQLIDSASHMIEPTDAQKKVMELFAEYQLAWLSVLEYRVNWDRAQIFLHRVEIEQVETKILTAKDDANISSEDLKNKIENYRVDILSIQARDERTRASYEDTFLELQNLYSIRKDFSAKSPLFGTITQKLDGKFKKDDSRGPQAPSSFTSDPHQIETSELTPLYLFSIP
jgi:hypothetical protein